MPMKKCDNCSRDSKTIYHVGKCPKNFMDFIEIVEPGTYIVDGCKSCGCIFACLPDCPEFLARMDKYKS